MENSAIPFITAFTAGVISFLSPCVLPLLPAYTAFLAGTGTARANQDSNRHFIFNVLCFLGGFTMIFVAMGATASYFGQFFYAYQHVIRKTGAVFMIAMGMHLLGIMRLTLLHREYRPLLNGTFQGSLGAFMLGIAFTAGWTPCTGPILASILIYAGTSATVSQGVWLLFVYAMGFCLPFFMIALFLKYYLTTKKVLCKELPLIRKLAGIILIVIGIFIYFDLMQKGLGIMWGLFAQILPER